MVKRIPMLLLVIFLLAGCSQGGTVMSYSERQAAASKLDFRLAQQSNLLGLKLFSQLRDKSGGNLTISPYSIATALALAYNGSAGETAEELGQLLGYSPGELQKLNASQQALLAVMQDAGPGIKLKLANSVWGTSQLPLRKDYLKTGKAYYEAEIRTTDLAAPRSVTEINGWVSKHTEHTITKMLDQPPGPDALAVLVNALYFKGGWKDAFPGENTRQAAFHLSADEALQVPMMSRNGYYSYAAQEDWQAIRIPYGAEQMDMLVILPGKHSSLEDLEARLAEGGFPAEEDFENQQGTVGLPRFTASYGTDLKDAVQALGVKQAFDPAKGDFSKLAEIPDPIYISKIIHKTYVDVNEKGTEASASTLVEMRMGAVPSVGAPFQMTVDRPFLFVIEDRQTGVWLFLGAIENPLLSH
ncbi:serpin family protein [Paenibacillus graminis]|uniref:serpin family protein n=1 Tax=Paenibacillus graminis TaxID=189425 RepID=UPI002DC01DAF|nr:serpin family protein [Paenibacillus graminis]MEC0166770.1 serpin family protein [Paenibacillus graminis]